MTTTLSNSPVKPANAINIGRPGMFGNPYIIGPDQTRTRVIQLYAGWVAARVQNDELFRKAFLVLKDKELWCPGRCSYQGLACHGDVIVRMLDHA